MNRSIANFALLLMILTPSGPVFAQGGTAEPNDPETRYFESIRLNNEAHIFSSRGEYDRAIESATKAIQLAPRYGTAYNNLGYAYLLKGELPKAVEALTTAIGILGANPVTLISRGEAYRQSGQDDAALADLNEAIRLLPSHYVAYRSRGLVYKAKGQNDQAAADFDEALRLKPDDAAALQSRREIYQAKGETPPPDPAQGDTARSNPGIQPFRPVENTPQGEAKRRANMRELLMRGMPADQRADPDRVIAEATAAINAKPEAAVGYWRRAYGYVAKGDIDRAIEDYGALVKLDPRNPQVYLYRAFAQESQDRLYDALDDLIAAARLERKHLGLIINLVDDKIAKIVPGMEKTGVVLVPGGTRAKLALCVKYYRERRYPEALIDLNTLVEEEPALAGARLFRGASLAAVGDFDRAAADFKEAARLSR